MKNEKSENNKENEYNYIKNICYNMDNGKLMIVRIKNIKVIYMEEKYQGFYLI